MLVHGLLALAFLFGSVNFASLGFAQEDKEQSLFDPRTMVVEVEAGISVLQHEGKTIYLWGSPSGSAQALHAFVDLLGKHDFALLIDALPDDEGSLKQIKAAAGAEGALAEAIFPGTNQKSVWLRNLIGVFGTARMIHSIKAILDRDPSGEQRAMLRGFLTAFLLSDQSDARRAATAELHRTLAKGMPSLVAALKPMESGKNLTDAQVDAIVADVEKIPTHVEDLEVYTFALIKKASEKIEDEDLNEFLRGFSVSGHYLISPNYYTIDQDAINIAESVKKALAKSSAKTLVVLLPDAARQAAVAQLKKLMPALVIKEHALTDSYGYKQIKSKRDFFKDLIDREKFNSHELKRLRVEAIAAKKAGKLDADALADRAIKFESEFRDALTYDLEWHERVLAAMERDHLAK